MKRLPLSPAHPLPAVLIAAALLGPVSTARGGNPCGPVCDETWMIADSPYVATCDVTVAAGCYLTIEAGVEVTFPFADGLQIDGQLQITGTLNDPVLLRSEDPDGGPWSWGGVSCQGSSECAISYATIRQASTGIFVRGGMVTLTNVVSQENGTGLWVLSDTAVSPDVNVTQSAFVGNTDGVKINPQTPAAADPSATITDSEIHSNSGWNYIVGTYSDPDKVLDATGNWWGSADPNVIREGIRDRASSSLSAIVDWCGYLDGPAGSPVATAHCADALVCDGIVEWNLTDKPYELLTSTLVCPTGELRIAAGVEVQAVGPAGMLVSGTLSVNGVPGSEVLLHPADAAPGTGTWNGIECRQGSHCSLSWAAILQPFGVSAKASATLELTDVTLTDSSIGARIEGGAGAFTRLSTFDGNHGVWLQDGTASLTDVSATGHASSAVKIDGGTATVSGLVARQNFFGLWVRTNSTSGGPIVTVVNSEIAETTLSAVSVGRNSSAYPDPTLSITGSSLYANGENYQVTSSFMAPNTVLDATGNWWGNTDPMVIREGILDGGSPAGPRVDWCGYLDGPGGSEVGSGHCADAVICDGTVVWDLTDKPYELLSDVFVCETGELQIMGGVNVHGLGGTGFEVEGSLSVNGSLFEEVLLTVANPATGAGTWDGVRCSGNASCNLSRAEIRNASATVSAENDSNLELTDSTIREFDSGVRISDNTVATLTRVSTIGGNYGVSIWGGTVTVTDLTTLDNHAGLAINGGITLLDGVISRMNTSGLEIHADAPASVAVQHSEFSGNSYRGVEAGGGNPSITMTSSSLHSNPQNLVVSGPPELVIHARGNWWGSADSEIIREGIVDAGTGTTGAVVDWCDYLDAPGGSPVAASHCADVRVCGEPIVWELTDRPYELVTQVVVCEGGELQIGAGVEVNALEPGSLLVEGTLSVLGSAGSEVKLGSANPAAGLDAWGGVTCVGDSTCTIAHADIAQAAKALVGQDSATLWITDTTADVNGTGIEIGSGNATLTRVSATNGESGVLVEGGAAVLTDVTASGHSGVGVEVRAGTATLNGVVARENWHGLLVQNSSPTESPSVTVVRSEFVENDTGVRVGSQNTGWPDPFLSVTGSSLHSSSFANYEAGSFFAADTVLDATGNWWGSSDPMVIRERISDRASSTGSAWVDWCGYLDGPQGSPAQAGHCAGGLVCDEVLVLDLVDKPYELLTDLFVCETGELQIEPGVEVHGLANRTEIIVEGTLTVSGAAGSQVLLASADADAGAGAWPGVRCQENATCSMEHAEVRQATVGVRAMDAATMQLSDVIARDNEYGVLLESTSDGTLTRVSAIDNDWGFFLQNPMNLLTDVTATGNNESGLFIRSSADLIGVVSRMNRTGLWVQASWPSPVVNVVQSEIVGNDEYGVRVGRFNQSAPDPLLTLTASSLHGNGSANYSADSFDDPESTLWATDCWWGSMDPNVIRQGIFDHDDDPSSPHVRFSAFGESCETALGEDTDGDGRGDFGDNCPLEPNADQMDGDGDGMGDACDPDPDSVPGPPCDGIDDALDGFLDSDLDGWGDPCDFHPVREDSHPGAAELCDARDNDGDGQFVTGELADSDDDGAIQCGDCDDLAPQVNYCACESCSNQVDDDCDVLVDLEDLEDCGTRPYCILVSTTAGIDLALDKGTCSGGIPATPVDVIRGSVAQLALIGPSVDLGQVDCVAGSLVLDRVTDVTVDSDPRCNDPLAFYLAKPSSDSDFGQSSTGENRDLTDPDPACP